MQNLKEFLKYIRRSFKLFSSPNNSELINSLDQKDSPVITVRCLFLSPVITVRCLF